MQQNISFSVFKAIRFIKQYRELYGNSKAIRATCHYGIRVFKKINKYNLEKPIRINNYEMFLIPNDLGISQELSVFKSHEPISTKIISNILKKGMTCLDIGGNIGYYVFLERQLVGDTGKIITIEPSLRNFNYLKKNIHLQKFTNILTYNFACSDKDGKVNLLTREKSNGCKVIPDGTIIPNSSLGTTTEVNARKLDNLINELKLNRIDFVRMDVEGYELYIIKGMIELLKKYRPTIHIELHKRQLGSSGTLEFFEIMKNLNYDVQYYFPRDLDVPIIGSIKDAKNYSISELINLIEQNKLQSFLMLLLQPIEKFETRKQKN